MPMFTGDEGEEFPLSTASDWTANYRAAEPGATKAYFFGQQILSDILAQEDCVGIRIYYAIDDEGAKHMILVGVNEDGNDQTSGIVAQRGIGCPSYCDSGGSTLLDNTPRAK
jgi:hypothetical protein